MDYLNILLRGFDGSDEGEATHGEKSGNKPGKKRPASSCDSYNDVDRPRPCKSTKLKDGIPKDIRPP